MLKLIISSLKITTKRVAFSALILALLIILSLVSKFFGFAIFVNFDFLKIEYADFILLVGYRMIGVFYISLLTITNCWLRILYCGDGVVDMLSLMLADLFFIWFYVIVDYYSRCFYWRYINQKKATLSVANDYAITTFGVMTSVVLTSLTMCFLNWIFIYDLYIAYLHLNPQFINLKALIVPFVLPFNLIKFLLNGVCFLIIYRTVLILETRLQINNNLLWERPLKLANLKPALSWIKGRKEKTTYGK